MINATIMKVCAGQCNCESCRQLDRVVRSKSLLSLQSYIEYTIVDTPDMISWALRDMLFGTVVIQKLAT